MKNSIVKYGLIAGLIAAACQLIVALVIKSFGTAKAGFEYSEYVGYTLIIASMSVIYFGVKSHRDAHRGGKQTFLEGLVVGLGIMLIACAFYSLAWLVVYYNFLPTFIDDYTQYYLDKLKAAGSSAEDLAKAQAQLSDYKAMFKSPVTIFAITMIEPMPIGTVFSVIAALILRKK